MKGRHGGLVLASGAALVLALVVGRASLRKASRPPAANASAAAPAASLDEARSLALPVASLARPRFAWPVPGAVVVVEQISKSDGEATTTYAIEICRRGNDQFVVTQRDFKFQRIQ